MIEILQTAFTNTVAFSQKDKKSTFRSLGGLYPVVELAHAIGTLI